MDDRPRLYPTLRTLTIAGLGAGKPATSDLASPIHMSATFLRDADNGYRSGQVYGRADNAGLQAVEALLAKLDHACEAMLFGSGTAAATALLVSLEPTRILAPVLMYCGLKTWLCDRAERYGHDVRFVDMGDLDALDAALAAGGVGLVWIETPSNPLWTVTDIAAVRERAHRAGALVCADATAATPVLTRALDFGADFVVHSATKYLNGHSDVMAGVVGAARPSPLWSRTRAVRDEHGAVPGPMDVWLLMRGLRTLDLRVRTQSASALFLAERLRNHPGVSAVLYPGLPDHPAHALAARQMRGGFGGMLSIRVRGGAAAAVRAAANVRLWRRATSFGGVESLIEHRASIEGEGSLCPDDLLRLSVGLEDPDDLHFDLAQALDSAL